MSHTPGPWEATFDSCASCGGEWIIDGPPGGSHGQFSGEADARLIAAAPDLFAACRGIVARSLRNGEAHLDVPELRAVAAAIAKAEGR